MKSISCLPLLVCAFLSSACGDKDIVVETDEVLTEDFDADQDGYPASEDCDDLNIQINPAAAETCDGIDNNCNGQVDENVIQRFFLDEDGDGFGGYTSIEACEPPSGYVPVPNDCNDSNENIYPSAPEQCDSLDNNCDGQIDENLNTYWYLDLDNDSFGNPDFLLEQCLAPQGYVADNSDCNDSEPAAHPFGEEICDDIDNDCDGVIDEGLVSTFYLDADEDGYGDPNSPLDSCSSPSGYVTNADDCNDEEPEAYTFAQEICDEIDNNCDGQVDENLTADWYLDLDQDGFGDANQVYHGCTAPRGFIADDSDCLDSNPNAFPGALEVCDSIDNNCDGLVDENLVTTYFLDSDSDGYGDAASSLDSCLPVIGYVLDSTDCNDSNNAVYPNAPELCDNFDNDCDGQINNGLISVYFEDADGDGFGDPSAQQTDCSTPAGFVSNADDCDDSNPQISPLAIEFCDELDNDCNGLTDEGVQSTFYLDYDMDGFGDINQSTQACSPPQFYVADSSDCNDTVSTAYPGAIENCNNIDDNCVDGIDENFLTNGIYTDIDNCGSCGNDCTQLIFPQATPICDDSLGVPECGFVCDNGFVDVNLDSSDGCECEFLSTFDPIFDGVDANCDGTDGDHNFAIHVSSGWGSPNGSGSLLDPVDSISTGLNQAQSQGLSYVLVEAGNYQENIELVDGINILGGMDSNFFLRDPDNYATVIDGIAGSPAIRAVNISSATAIEGLSIFAPSDNISSSSVIGIYIENSSAALLFSDNIIIADDAEDGIDGGNGQDGGNGEDGFSGSDGGYYDCSYALNGGSGGINSCSSGAVDGGVGASILCPSSGQTQPSGSDGLGADQGAGGDGSCDAYLSNHGCTTCFVTGCWEAGENGETGGDGPDGDGGLGAQTTGAFSGLTWITEDGQAGSIADDGSGGGGGGAGAGGNNTCNANQHHAGGTGGGGGAGGCGGEGGVAGTGGGSSFGVFVNCSGCTSLPIFINNEIGAGDGGSGGDGGDGGLGGLPGLGGLGGLAARSSAFCAEDGGDGGTGGYGGDGGGGGGGAGGNSYAVYVRGFSPDPLWVDADNDLDGGLPGLGGRGGRGGSRANDGGDGISGSNGDQNW